MSLQKQLSNYGGREPRSVIIEGPNYKVRAMLCVAGNTPLLTVKKPRSLYVYQVKGSTLVARGPLKKSSMYAEFAEHARGATRTFKGGIQGAILTSATEDECHAFVVQFLRLNPEPSDAQVHELACAIGLDHETLEAEIYKMLGREVQATTDDEKILDGQKDPWRSATELAPLNDTGFEGDMITEIQDDTRDDGIPEEEQ